MKTKDPKQVKILFVCTGNAGRSQLAQALFQRLAGDAVVALSAGVEPWPDLHPVAVKILRERGFDVHQLHPKHVGGFVAEPLDFVITIGDRARAEIPAFEHNPVILHWDIADPADADGTGRERRVFDVTTARIEARLPELLESVFGRR